MSEAVQVRHGLQTDVRERVHQQTQDPAKARGTHAGLNRHVTRCTLPERVSQRLHLVLCELDTSIRDEALPARPAVPEGARVDIETGTRV